MRLSKSLLILALLIVATSAGSTRAQGVSPPVLDSIGGAHAAHQGVLMRIQVRASDPDMDSIVLSVVGLPTNATFTDSGNGTGIFDFTPDFFQEGVFPVTFIASDLILADSELVMITVGLDTVFVENVTAMVGETVDILVSVKNIFGVAGITIPIKYTGTGITLLSGVPGSRSGSSVFAVFTELLDPIAQTGLYGFISFFDPMPAGSGDVLLLKFEIDAGAAEQLYLIDTATLPPANILALEADSGTVTPIEFVMGSIDTRGVGIGDGSALKPVAYALNQNFPNPFNADTRISFALSKADQVRLRVFNVLGQEVVTLVDGLMDANQHDIIWDGTNAQGTVVASGTYFYRLEIGDVYEKTLRMTLLK